MNNVSSAGNYSIASTAAASLDSGAAGITPKQQLTTLKVEQALRKAVDEALADDNAAMTIPQDGEQGGAAVSGSESDKDRELIPFDIKEMRKHRMTVEEDSVEDNTTFGPHVGLGGQYAEAGVSNERVVKAMRSTQILDGLMGILDRK